MLNLVKRSGMAFALAGIIGIVPALASQAQTPSDPGQRQQPRDPAPISGELVSLDARAKTLSVKTAAGAEMKFTYTDTTEVVGAEKGVSGLATMSGSPVTVTYKIQGMDNEATKIEVRAKQ